MVSSNHSIAGEWAAGCLGAFCLAVAAVGHAPPPQPLARHEALKARGRRGGAMTALAGEPPHEHIPPPTTRITLQLDTASSV